MQITKIYSFNNNIYRTNNNRSVNFKSAEEKMISPKVMNMMKRSLIAVYDFSEFSCPYSDLNDVNKYIVPNVHRRLNNYPLSPSLQIVIVPSKQLEALVGEVGKNTILSQMDGICVAVADMEGDIEKCDMIYETTVCLVPNPSLEPSLYEIYKKRLMD